MTQPARPDRSRSSGVPSPRVARAPATLRIPFVHVAITERVLRQIAQRVRERGVDASLSPQAQVLEAALHVFYGMPENSARGRKGR